MSKRPKRARLIPSSHVNSARHCASLCPPREPSVFHLGKATLGASATIEPLSATFCPNRARLPARLPRSGPFVTIWPLLYYSLPRSRWPRSCCPWRINASLGSPSSPSLPVLFLDCRPHNGKCTGCSLFIYVRYLTACTVVDSG